MRALIVYCHPREESFTAAVRDVVLSVLGESGAEVRLIDLYADGFDPVLSAEEHGGYLATPDNQAPVSEHVDHLLWCDTLVFVYPTWWYGTPAMLKGWLDRVLLPDVAFRMPQRDGETIAPGLTHIERLAVLTTCGASWWLTRIVGAPGRRTILRGVGLLCRRPLKTLYLAHYLMDSSTPASRAAHLDKVARKLEKFVPRSSRKERTA